MQLAVFGLFLFLLLWETRSRYLVNFVPVFFLLGLDGALKIREWALTLYTEKIRGKGLGLKTMERTAEKNTDWKERVRMYWPVLALLAYVGINLFLLSRHENWRDEAQAWQIAKNLGLGGLFAQLRYEGHPCLWYLILMPFAKLGLPFSCMGLISLAFMSVAAWLVLKKAPFSWPVKLVLVFGSFFVYYYPVISRSYSLIPPLLAVLAVLYPCRKEKGILYGAALAALTQTHVYMAGLSFLLSFFWLCETAADLWKQKQPGENKSALAGLGLSLLSGLFLAWELLGSTELNPSSMCIFPPPLPIICTGSAWEPSGRWTMRWVSA